MQITFNSKKGTTVDNSILLEHIAKHLLNKREQGIAIPDLSSDITLNSIDDVLAVQKLMIKLNNQKVYGWKCMLPSGDGTIILAPLLHAPVKSMGRCALFTKNNKALIEPEIAFVLNKDLASYEEYKNEDIDNAIGSAHLALELIQNRFPEGYQATHYEKLADGLSNQGVYLGPKVDVKKAYESSDINIDVKQGEDLQSYAGKHPAGLPQLPLYWAINFLTENGFELKAGHIFITGSYNGLMQLDINKKTSIKYEGLGEITVEFSC